MAREKAEDLIIDRYFSHKSPTFGSPFKMMKARGIAYQYAGENIASGYFTPESVVKAWMNSAGYKRTAGIYSSKHRQKK